MKAVQHIALEGLAKRLNATPVAVGRCTDEEFGKGWVWVTLKPLKPLHKWWANSEPYSFYITEDGKIHC